MIKYILIFAPLIISGCGLFQGRPDSTSEILQKASNQKIFFASYDQVWKAAHATLKYTIASENQDYGVIETDYIKAVDGYVPPYQTKPEIPGSRYKLVMSFAKGQTNGRESTRVTIEKKIEVFKNVISDVQTLPSDGLEERIIFYRMERELVIASALKRAAESNSNEPAL